MKKLFTILAGVALSMSAVAQQVPNGGFETWTSATNPDSWGTIASAFGNPGYSYFATKDVSAGNFVQGLASLKLLTDTVNAGGSVITTGALAGLGTASYVPGSGIVVSGVPYTKRVDTIYFSYKYTPATATDTAFMNFDLTKGGNSLFGGNLGLGISTTAGTWQSVYLPLYKNDTSSGNNYYVTGQNPDTLHILFVSSTDTGTHAFHSTLWVDAISFDAAVDVSTSINELNGKVNGVNVFPNPANNTLNIAVEADEIGSQIILTDMTGREVYNTTISTDKFALDTRNYESGVYSIRVNSNDKMTTYKGKVTITH